MKALHMIAYVLLWVGGLNWGVYGLTGWDIGQLFGPANNGVARVVYVLVGLAALVSLFTHKAYCKHCASSPTA